MKYKSIMILQIIKMINYQLELIQLEIKFKFILPIILKNINKLIQNKQEINLYMYQLLDLAKIIQKLLVLAHLEIIVKQFYIKIKKIKDIKKYYQLVECNKESIHQILLIIPKKQHLLQGTVVYTFINIANIDNCLLLLIFIVLSNDIFLLFNYFK